MTVVLTTLSFLLPICSCKQDVSPENASNPFFVRTLSFRVVNVSDEGVIDLQWLEKRRFFRDQRVESTQENDISQVELLGVWSEKQREPEEFFKRRIQFLRQHLLNQTVTAKTHSVFPLSFGGGGEAGRAARMIRPGYEEIDREIFLHGKNVSELVLENGYAFFDESDFYNSKGLFAFSKADRQRYEAVEIRARSAGLGIWSTKESAEKYSEIERRESLKRSGGFYYVLAQGILALVIGLLMFSTRHDSVGKNAAFKLLSLPLILLLPEALRWFWGASSSRTAKVSDVKYLIGIYRYVFLALIVFTIYVVIKQLAILLAHGPLKQWKELWKISKARQVVWAYFLGLWVISLVFGLTYYLVGCASLKISFGMSFAHTLGLKYPFQLPPDSSCHLMSQVSALILLLWTALCLFIIPKLPEHTFKYSLSSVLLNTVGSLLMLLLVVASVFTNIYAFNIELNGLSEPLDRLQSFFFALAPAFRQTYRSLYATSGWLLAAQVVQLHLILFLQAVSFRILFAILGNAVKARLRMT